MKTFKHIFLGLSLLAIAVSANAQNWGTDDVYTSIKDREKAQQEQYAAWQKKQEEYRRLQRLQEQEEQEEYEYDTYEETYDEPTDSEIDRYNRRGNYNEKKDYRSSKKIKKQPKQKHQGYYTDRIARFHDPATIVVEKGSNIVIVTDNAYYDYNDLYIYLNGRSRYAYPYPYSCYPWDYITYPYYYYYYGYPAPYYPYYRHNWRWGYTWWDPFFDRPNSFWYGYENGYRDGFIDGYRHGYYDPYYGYLRAPIRQSNGRRSSGYYASSTNENRNPSQEVYSPVDRARRSSVERSRGSYWSDDANRATDNNYNPRDYRSSAPSRRGSYNSTSNANSHRGGTYQEPSTATPTPPSTPRRRGSYNTTPPRSTYEGNDTPSYNRNQNEAPSRRGSYGGSSSRSSYESNRYNSSSESNSSRRGSYSSSTSSYEGNSSSSSSSYSSRRRR